ncbi:pimeloyl-ACP methyl ester carboxylesterase [Paenibacillus pabuli]|uniref:Pimeloyl-ACP methyl ester carboxylesterase n=1 Tax=Paenibacillus pabuli TaxID=1472 RepID=A0ABX9BLL7_9BACL|nr:alpha/beta hydrolase [Paenibacillus pabuli]RAI97394.1 pimeloyl-ACP methyl ester carboxylesterase [Paenibacillus pabuli]
MRKRSIKIFRRAMLSILLLVIIALIFPTWTPGIKGENSISTLGQVEINGAGHEVMIRGTDRNNSILLFVHGGPGCSEIPYVRKYQQELEQHFTIVHYDQRGSGKSYHFMEDYSDVTSDVLVDDLLALTDYVTAELEQRKVTLVGHSFGTYIGTKAAAKAPEKFIAYVGIGQVADTVQSELDSLEYTITQAKQADSTADAESLERLRNPIERGEKYTPRKLVRKYGGAARLIDDNRDYMLGFLLGTEYNALDVIRYSMGVQATQEILLKEESTNHLPDIVDQLEIPTYFVMGKYDYMTSLNAARDYFDELGAPEKDFVVFEESAHYPQFEEKERFAAWLMGVFNF